jgi:hypothetical protein
MATTSLEAVREREWGLAGSVRVVCSRSGFLRSWKWSVESHDAEMRSAGTLVSKYRFESGEVPTVLFAVDYLFDRGSMCAEYCLLSRLEIYSRNIAYLGFVNNMVSLKLTSSPASPYPR